MEQGRSAAGRRLAIEVQYDGTYFNGWQVQNGGRTVQHEIEHAAGILFREKIRATASGRTDAGVHASGQIVHFNTASEISLQRICIGLNGILPRDISVKNAYDVPADFHARFNATKRHYRYLVYNHPSRNPFAMNRMMWVHEPLDVDYIQRAAESLIGEKDFASFCKKSEAAGKRTIRRIDQIDIRKIDELIIADIYGNAFLHNMIRIIMGTLLDMHRNGADPASMEQILMRKDRNAGGPTAPAYGLYLMKVWYEPSLAGMNAAFN